VAVGAYDASSGYLQTLIESWDGSAWSIVPSPDGSSTNDNQLTGVSCVKAAICIAVGSYGNSSGVTQNLIESWNGTTWSLVASPDEGTQEDEGLTGVKCTSPTACKAVGLYVSNTTSATETLIESWNGTEWSIDASPDAGYGDNELNHVTCTSSTSCTAVGDFFNASDVDQTLVERWNGQQWSIVPSPSEQASNNALESVACVSSTDCVAIGHYENGATALQTLIESWNGAVWSLVLSPNEGSSANFLYGVAHAGSARWLAVGGYTLPSSGPTLVESAFPLKSSTSLTSVTARPVAGQPITVKVTVAASRTALVPTGQVTVSDGRRRCAASLTGSKGTASGTCSITELAAGRYSFTASYPGDFVFLPSGTSKPAAVAVSKAPSATDLKLSVAHVTRGDEQTEHISVVVKPKFAGVVATGAVTVETSAIRICVIKLSSAKGSCALTSKQLAPGTYHLFAAYGGNSDLVASKSSNDTLTVVT